MKRQYAMLNPKRMDSIKLLLAHKIRRAENNRGYIDLDGIRLVYDFDLEEIVGWYQP